MNSDIEMYKKTASWLETELVKCARRFQLARAEADREKAKIQFNELNSRVLIETRALKALMRGD